MNQRLFWIKDMGIYATTVNHFSTAYIFWQDSFALQTQEQHMVRLCNVWPYMYTGSSLIHNKCVGAYEYGTCAPIEHNHYGTKSMSILLRFTKKVMTSTLPLYRPETFGCEIPLILKQGVGACFCMYTYGMTILAWSDIKRTFYGRLKQEKHLASLTSTLTQNPFKI